MEDADHGASPTTVEVHDKEHYRPKLHAPAHRFLFIFYGYTEGLPQSQCTKSQIPSSLHTLLFFGKWIYVMPKL
jgi:hypothetical protein